MREPSTFHVSKASRSRFEPEGLRPYLEYRDLGIAHVTGGRWRASMSRTRLAQDGGTGLHRHALEHQVVYVLNGGATFEYAQFGPHRVIAGDCVYQPAGIVHQQVERSADCIVLEVVSPAAFETEPVPMSDYRAPHPGPTRQFSVVRAAETGYVDHPRHRWLARRDLGIETATGGDLGAHLSRPVEVPPLPGPWHCHEVDFHLLLVLQGIYRVEYEDHGEHTLLPGDCVHQPGGCRHRVLERSPECEILEIASPAVFATESA